MSGNAYTQKRPVRAHPTDPTAALVELTKGYWAVIDAADATEVGQFNWCAKIQRGVLVYGMRAYRSGGILSSQTLHRFVGDRMGLSMSIEVDHDNGNGLDCRRQNLRDATRAENTRNTPLRRDSKSGIKGVTWDRNKWRATVAAGRKVACKRFDTKEEAAAWVTRTRMELHGNFANHGTKENLQ